MNQHYILMMKIVFVDLILMEIWMLMVIDQNDITRQVSECHSIVQTKDIENLFV
jgi:hypothetical protein